MYDSHPINIVTLGIKMKPKPKQASVQFARAHNIGISVFSTGHDFNDRGGGPGNNTLLVHWKDTFLFSKWDVWNQHPGI